MPALQADLTGKADFFVDFEVVALGDRKLEHVKVRNTGSRELVVMGDPAEEPFSNQLPSAGLKIAPGGSAELIFGFEPERETAEPVETFLTLRTNEEGGATYTVRLIGRGAMPTLSCTPKTLEYGPVLKGTPRELTVSCTNPLPFALGVEARLRGRHVDAFRLSSEGEGERIVEAGGDIILQLEALGLSMGRNDATLELVESEGQLLASVPLRAETIDSSLVVTPESCLDFGYVSIGERAVDALVLRTVGGLPLRVTKIELPEESRPAFSVLSPTPIDMPGTGERREVEIAFHPFSGGPAETRVEIHAERPEGGELQIVSACAKGFGGGPAIHCSPARLDFGSVALGMKIRQTISCTNVGVSAPDVPIDPLFVDSPRTDQPEFQAILRNDDGSEGPKPGGYQLGETFEIEVAYEPSAEGFDFTTVTLESASAPGGKVETEVSGEGRDLPSCQFAIRPPRLDFGIIERGERRTRSFGIQNLLSTACLLHNLRLKSDSDGAFSLTPFEHLELAGDETLHVEVHFEPLEYRDHFDGEVVFQISSIEEPEQRVALRGAAAKPCLVFEPRTLDFGAVGPTCSSSDLWVSATNLCGAPIEITGAVLDDTIGAEAFMIRQRPVLPTTLTQHERVEFKLAFGPEALGDYAGALRFDIADSEPYLLDLLGTSSPNPVQTDLFDQAARPKVDILWVIDNSSSMSPFQSRLAENLGSFLDGAREQNVDFHLAVTSNGLRPASYICGGGANGGEDGRFFPINGARPRILTPNTPNLEQHWSNNVRVGLCHGDEYHLEAAYRALSEPLINERKSSKHFNETHYNDGNAGFLRREAALSIIFVTEEPDKSEWRSLHEYFEFFRGLKGTNRFRAHAITGSKASETSSCGIRNSDRLRYLVDKTGGNWMDICTPTGDSAAWAAGLRRMSLGAFGFDARFELRGAPSDRNGDDIITEDDILLTVDGVPQAAVGPNHQRRWRYIPDERAILFEPLFIPPSGSQIAATYSVACRGP